MKTKIYTLLVLFIGCASWASAEELNYTKSRKVTKKVSRAISGRSLTRAQASRSSIIFDDNHFIPSIPDNHFRTKTKAYGQVWIGPLGGDGVFLGPLGGEGVFTTILDRMVMGELSNVGKLDDNFNLLLAPGDLSSMQKQALKTGDVEVLGLLIIMFRQVDNLFWWTVDGRNF